MALLDQHVVAGIGNIYASEALHLARLSPFRLASTIVTGPAHRGPAANVWSGDQVGAAPRDCAEGVGAYRGSRFRVYERDGERCPTPGCRGTIARVWQAGRSTFYCPVCQR